MPELIRFRATHAFFPVAGFLVLTALAIAQENQVNAPNTEPEMEFSANQPESFFTIRVHDEQGNPISDAHVYGRYRITTLSSPTLESLGPIATELDGVAKVPVSLLFPQGFPDRQTHPDEKLSPIYIIHEQRRLVGLRIVEASEQGKTINVPMQSPCVVKGEVVSSELSRLGHSYTPYRVYVTLKSLPYRMKMPLWLYSSESEFELWLPENDYLFNVFSDKSYAWSREVAIDMKRKELNLGTIDLPSRIQYRLVGNPAIELRNIKGWMNSEPLSLEKLRGEVVLLDFWGYWCGPCIAVMPQLFELHEKFSDHGLVIIGVHDDSVESVESLNGKLETIREKHWSGHDIPFPVALAGGGKTPIQGAGQEAAGTVVADYGVLAWPTYLLIDRDGTIVMTATNKNKDELYKKVNDLLGE